jgi:hypothetical protein
MATDDGKDVTDRPVNGLGEQGIVKDDGKGVMGVYQWMDWVNRTLQQMMERTLRIDG